MSTVIQIRITVLQQDCVVFSKVISTSMVHFRNSELPSLTINNVLGHKKYDICFFGRVRYIPSESGSKPMTGRTTDFEYARSARHMTEWDHEIHCIWVTTYGGKEQLTLPIVECLTHPLKHSKMIYEIHFIRRCFIVHMF